MADFIVREDGSVREVLDVRPADKLMQIALLVDDSEAATEATSHLRDGLAALLERLHGKAEIALITIGERPTVVTQYTKDTELLKKRPAGFSRDRRPARTCSTGSWTRAAGSPSARPTAR